MRGSERSVHPRSIDVALGAGAGQSRLIYLSPHVTPQHINECSSNPLAPPDISVVVLVVKKYVGFHRGRQTHG